MTTDDTNTLRAIRRELCEMEKGETRRMHGWSVTRNSDDLTDFTIGNQDCLDLGLAEQRLMERARA